MKLRLKLNPERKEQIQAELESIGVEIDEGADLILTELNYRDEEIICKKAGESFSFPVNEILYVESLGKDVFVYRCGKSDPDTIKYSTDKRLYELEKMLPSDMFIRVSNSVIIKKNSIKALRPALGQKFYLTLRNGTAVDVTRSYYVRFKEYFNI